MIPETSEDLLRGAMQALQAVIQEGLTFATEQDAEQMLARIQRAVA
jgi:hypothetical protein